VQQLGYRMDTWIERVELLAGRVDAARVRLVVHNPDLGDEQPAVMAVAVARKARDDIVVSVRSRMENYPIGRFIPSGEAWDNLQKLFWYACFAAQSVRDLLNDAVVVLLQIESCMTTPYSASDLVHLDLQQLVYFRGVQAVITSSTNRVLNLACSLFATGHRSGVTFASFSRPFDTSQH